MFGDGFSLPVCMHDGCIFGQSAAKIWPIARWKGDNDDVRCHARMLATKFTPKNGYSLGWPWLYYYVFFDVVIINDIDLNFLLSFLLLQHAESNRFHVLSQCYMCVRLGILAFKYFVVALVLACLVVLSTFSLRHSNKFIRSMLACVFEAGHVAV